MWLSTRDFKFEEGYRKRKPTFMGLFKVMERVNEVTYKLDFPRQCCVLCSSHVILLKPVVLDPLVEATPNEQPPPPVVVDGALVYTVRRLLDSRWRGGCL